ncbi:glycosyltransferase family 4 protein [Geobacter pickeringii]|uniref:Glycosyltransferase subfamily 4-like N-terminal domain-containing protein n=1 Tax=Geobacter pickeringii TaxID=345632 RepID=A0A0B5B8B6_9BACT|nr:glycosyltransferase family 4 protein [Geobacter pickeringii]AJE02802.1 hypothetical protein GPICK_04970 [Geobacter pickeringii]
MNILYVSSMYPPSLGGAQVHLHHLAKEMQGSGHGVRVVTHTWRNRRDWLRFSTVLSEDEARCDVEGIDVLRMGFSQATRLRMLPWALSYYLLMGPAVRNLAGFMEEFMERRVEVPTLVHATRIGREFIARAALDFARRHGVPFVLTPNHHPRWKGPRYREYARIYREADALVALTAFERETLVREFGVDGERVHVTGIGPLLADRFSAEEFRERYGIKGRFVLYLGQQCRYKGIAALAAAAPRVWEKHPDVRFVFIGPPTAESRKLFGTLHDPRYLNLGAVDLETKTAALAACEFLCLPSAQESFGGVFVEAWSQRKAVIGGRIGPIACVVDEGENGLLSSQDPRELADAVARLLADPAACEAMGNAGWRKVQEQYAWPRLAEKTRAVYRSLGVGDA